LSKTSDVVLRAFLADHPEAMADKHLLYLSDDSSDAPQPYVDAATACLFIEWCCAKGLYTRQEADAFIEGIRTINEKETQ
jgi:hypothetical protein